MLRTFTALGAAILSTLAFAATASGPAMLTGALGDPNPFATPDEMAFDARMAPKLHPHPELRTGRRVAAAEHADHSVETMLMIVSSLLALALLSTDRDAAALESRCDPRRLLDVRGLLRMIASGVQSNGVEQRIRDLDEKYFEAMANRDVEIASSYSSGDVSRMNPAPTVARADCSEATTQPRSSRPSTSGRTPCGSRAA